jgi:CelD/BcsL family acetyltransferase involved in cellulose biosynthesis
VELYTIDPLSDGRWDDLVARHSRASAFHQRGWLQALGNTYGYQPYVLTSASAGKPLTDGVVLCKVSSWITGARSVSLPFADHCDPLINDSRDLVEFTNWLHVKCDRQHWKYFELRPLIHPDASCGLQPSRSYWLHRLDLAPSLAQIYRTLHRNSIQRKIRRAEKERLTYEVGNSEHLLSEFYRLMLITRRRLGVLPQPRSWFENLLKTMGDDVRIRLAVKEGAPIAALLTLRHRTTVIYKYGCSDGRFHNLGAMPFLFWKLIEESKAAGSEQIDFGRTDLNNKGLITFKDRCGTSKSVLTYYRYPKSQRKGVAPHWESRFVRRVCSMLPDSVGCAAGGVLYRHMG